MPNKLLNTNLFRTGKVELRKPGRQTWTLIATGDVRPNLESHGVLTSPGYPACSVREWLDADIVLGNLEAPVIAGRSLRRRFRQKLGSPPVILDVTGKMGFNLWNLANNHIRDFGEEGVLQTLAALDERGLMYFGAGRDRAAAERIIVLRQGKTRIAFAGTSQDENIAAGARQPGASVINHVRMHRDVRRMKQRADLAVMSIHSGYEFSDVPRLELFRLCRSLAAEGADVIFVNHPHVPHGMELYKGCIIFYSLGNFLFRMQPHSGTTWSTRSFVPRLTFSGKRLCGVELLPCMLDDGFVPRQARGRDRRAILRHVEKLTRMLNEREIDKSNREFVRRHVFDVIMGCVFAAGRRNDREWLDAFLGETMRKDPYLRCMKDMSRLWNRFPRFDEL